MNVVSKCQGNQPITLCNVFCGSGTLVQGWYRSFNQNGQGSSGDNEAFSEFYCSWPIRFWYIFYISGAFVLVACLRKLRGSAGTLVFVPRVNIQSKFHGTSFVSFSDTKGTKALSSSIFLPDNLWRKVGRSLKSNRNTPRRSWTSTANLDNALFCR